MSQVIAVLGMIATLALAWKLDEWVNVLRKFALVNFEDVPLLWGIAAANLIMAGLWVFTAWWMLKRMPGQSWISVIYFFVGFLVTIFVAAQLSVSEGWREWLLFEETRLYRMMVMGEIGLTSRFTLSAAFVCILGVVSFFVAKAEGVDW